MLLNPSNAEWKAARSRLERLVTLEGDTTMDTEPPGWQTFDQFIAANPTWSSEYIFHRENKVSLPRRHQLSGLCYMHAPVVLQHYLVSLNQPKVGMIDMTKMVRENFDSKALEKHVFDSDGGDSHKMLHSIWEPSSIIVASGVDGYEKNLKQYGPGLVQGFTVHTDFHENPGKLTSFDGAPKGNVVGHHAMVLIGARQDPGGKRYFLIQNWWKESQFIEMSEEYLKKCCMVVRFVKTPQHNIPDKFPTQPHLIAENENVDKPEQLMGEDPACPPPEYA